MTHEYKGHYREKHSADVKPDPRISEALKKKALKGELSCAAAHKIAESIGVSPEKVGVAMDFLEISIVKCQLGLFGYRPEKRIVKTAESVSKALEDALQASTENGRISCYSVWEIADRLNIKRMDASAACEALKIKIAPCQLAAF